MEFKNDEIIDVKGFDIQIDSESIPAQSESIYWFSAAETRNRLKLDKTPFRNVIVELLNVHKISEAAIRRGQGRATEYSQTAIALVRALKRGDRSAFDSLKQGVIEPPAPQTSMLTIAEYTPGLDRRIAELNQVSTSNSVSLAEDVQATLEQIAAENKAAKQRTSSLDTAEITAAQNRGAARALAVYQAEQKAHNELLAQLRAMQLGSE